MPHIRKPETCIIRRRAFFLAACITALWSHQSVAQGLPHPVHQRTFSVQANEPVRSGKMMHDYTRDWPAISEGVLTTPAGTTHEMALVPEGEFTMGGGSHHNDAEPVHPVYLSEYYIGRHEVTHPQFLEFTRATGQDPSWTNPTSKTRSCRKTE